MLEKKRSEAKKELKFEVLELFFSFMYKLAVIFST